MREVSKPWGRELWFAFNERYAGKIIEVEEGGSASVSSTTAENTKQCTFSMGWSG